MSLPRHRYKYTLGSKRLPPVDPFEKDPFKIHSYNFRYADRPSFPMPNSQQKTNNPRAFNDCETFYYNRGFSSTNNLNTARNHVDKRVLNLKKFQEYRKRRFLNRTGSNSVCDPALVKENSSSFNNGSSTSKLATSNNSKDGVHPTESSITPKTRYSTFSSLANLSNFQVCATNDMKPECSNRSMWSRNERWPSPKRFSTSSHTTANYQPKLSRGCEININIKGLDNNCLDEKANVEIETDSIYKNLNITSPKERPGKSVSLSSSDTYLLNESLSKFSSSACKQNDVNKMEKSRQLTSIYSSPRFTKSRIFPNRANRCLPSLTPFESCNYIASGLSFSQHNLTRQIPFIQRTKDWLSVYDTSKAVGKNWSRNNLSRKFHNKGLGETSSDHSRFKVFSKRHSSERIPLNVTINVAGNNLRLLNTRI